MENLRGLDALVAIASNILSSQPKDSQSCATPPGQQTKRSLPSCGADGKTWSQPKPTEIKLDGGVSNFMAEVKRLALEAGQPLRKVPAVGGRDLDMFRLYREVIARGGMHNVIKGKQWKAIAIVLNLPTSCTDCGFRLRKHYERYLIHYERRYFRPQQQPVLRVDHSMQAPKRQRCAVPDFRTVPLWMGPVTNHGPGPAPLFRSRFA